MASQLNHLKSSNKDYNEPDIDVKPLLKNDLEKRLE